MPTWLVPVMLEGPHEAAPSFHEDWTIAPGSNSDPAKWELELRLRDARKTLIQEYLIEGRSVFYKSSVNSMWPLVQARDACTFHPIQAVTARDGIHSIQKEASDCVGDIVFCQVQRSDQYYAHIVIRVEDSVDRSQETETRYTLAYWVGNIEQHVNPGRYDKNFPPHPGCISEGWDQQVPE